MKKVLRHLLRRLNPGPTASDIARIHEENFGAEIGEWPERALKAVEMLSPHHAHLVGRVVAADWGCGKQILRRLLPDGWIYVPYDRFKRSDDTQIIDFNAAVPDEPADVIFCLGLLEYVDDFWGVLGAAADRSRFLIFSYSGPAPLEQRKRNGWKSAHDFDVISDFLEHRKLQQLDIYDSAATGRVLLFKNNSRDDPKGMPQC